MQHVKTGIRDDLLFNVRRIVTYAYLYLCEGGIEFRLARP